MITTRLNGGLGNKLYQIAAAYSLAKDNSDVCAFNFNDHVVKQGRSACDYRNNVLKKVNEITGYWEPEYFYKEPSASYKEIPYHENMLLNGYFQSEKYFMNHVKEVIDLFTDELLIEYLKDRYDFKDSLSVHIRRGDYCGVSTCRPLSLNYYERALFAVDNNIGVRTIYIFSDDIEWCREIFKDKRIRFITGAEDYMDFYMMSLCKYNIIANSTFSGWASILNVNPDKIVIAPRQWSEEVWTEDIYCKDWIII